MIVGIDGCPNAWIAFTQADDGAIASEHFTDLEAFLDRHRPSVVAIDIPIGLTDSGARQCDILARNLLGPRKTSVFPAPIRPALAGRDRQSAHDISMAIHGKGVAAQSFGIYLKVREVDELLVSHPALRSILFEIHPELCFFEWNGEKPMTNPKRFGPGFMERLTLVESHFGPGAFDSVRSAHPRSKVADDDILDAFSALWTAQRIAAGSAIPCPNPPALDSERIPLVMWR